MGTGAITEYVDVAQIVLYLFWFFFAGLIYYLVRENHREGYPMDSGRENGSRSSGWPVPPAKTFKTVHGDVTVPDLNRDKRPLALERLYRSNSAPLEPTGNPLVDGVGPAAYAERANRPDETIDGQPKIVPLRTLADHQVAHQDLDPRGLPMLGCDGEVAGVVKDLWLDRSEMLVRYFEVETAVPQGARRVLVPREFARIERGRSPQLRCAALTAAQFAQAPALAAAERVTMNEEERIVAYFGGGMLYATPQRSEPLL